MQHRGKLHLSLFTLALLAKALTLKTIAEPTAIMAVHRAPGCR